MVKKTYYRKKRSTRKKTVTEPIKRYVKNTIDRNIENKYQYYGAHKDGITTAGTIYDLTELGHGTLGFQYIGESIKVMSMDLRFELFQSNSLFFANEDHNNIRVIVFQWKPRRNYYPPTIDRVLQYVSVVPNDYTLGTYNYETRKDYTVLYDRTFLLNSTPVWNGSKGVYYTGPGSQRIGRFRLKTSKINRNVTYDPAGDSINAGRNHIYMCVVSDSNYDPNPAISVQWNMTYQDA